MKAYLNGQFQDINTASIPLMDAGFQHSVGIFDTMQAFNGNVFKLDAHIQRLMNSAKALGLASNLRSQPLTEAVKLTLKENNLSDARIRLTLTGGNLALLNNPQSDDQPQHQPGIYIVPSLPTVYPESFFTNGITVTIADAKTNPLDPTAGHKTLNYWWRLQSLAAASTLGAGESLCFTVANHLCSGMVSNVFTVKDGNLLTPYARGEEPEGALPAPVLPGITRATVLELAKQLNIPTHTKLMDISHLLDADECFLTNSSWQILPVTHIEQQPVANANVGPITTQLMAELQNLIGAETSSN